MCLLGKRIYFKIRKTVKYKTAILFCASLFQFIREIHKRKNLSSLDVYILINSHNKFDLVCATWRKREMKERKDRKIRNPPSHQDYSLKIFSPALCSNYARLIMQKRFNYFKKIS